MLFREVHSTCAPNFSLLSVFQGLPGLTTFDPDSKGKNAVGFRKITGAYRLLILVRACDSFLSHGTQSDALPHHETDGLKVCIMPTNKINVLPQLRERTNF